MATIIGRHKEIAELNEVYKSDSSAERPVKTSGRPHSHPHNLGYHIRLKYNEYSGDFTNVVTLDHLLI